MTVGISVTDIAAKFSVDTSEFFRGMKLVENRVADFTASRAKSFELELPDIQKLIAENPAKFLQQEFAPISEENFKSVGKAFSDAILQNVDAASAEAQKIIAARIAYFQQQGYMQDQGAAHVQAFINEQINADGKMTELIIKNRQRIYAFDKEAHAYRLRAAKETADLEERIANAKLIESQRVAEMHKYEQQQRKQDAQDRMDASNAIRMRMERDARLQSSISEIFDRQNQRLEEQAHAGDRLYALNKRQTQERKALLSVIADIVHHEKMLGTFDADRAKALKEITASFRISQQQEQTALTDEMTADAQERAQRAANERLDTERKIEAVLNRQAAQYDEVYAFELKQKSARSEFARLLLQAKSQGVSNENLTGAATQFREAQAREKEAFNAARIAKENAAHAEELANWKQQDAHVQAHRLNQMEQEHDLQKRGAALIRSLATAQDLHNERVQEYGHMLRANIITQKQYTAAVKESERIMRASASGAGAYTGMLAQVSFAAEDFIQGIAMGDLRSALLGASNNLTMVVRGALQAGQGITVLGMGIKSLIGIIVGIPAAVIGAVAAFSYLNRAERDVRDLATALRDAERGFDLLQDRMNFRQQAGRERQRIDDIESLTQAQKEYQNVLRQQKDAEEQLTAARARQSRAGSETLINTLGGQAAYAEMQDFIAKLRRDTRAEGAKLGNDMAKAMSTAMSAAQAGEVEKMIDALRLLNQLSNSAQKKTFLGTADPGSLLYQLNLLLNDPTAQDSLEAIFNTGWMQQTEDQDKLRQIRESMLETTKEIARVENELKQATDNRKQLEEQIEKLKADGIRLSNEEFKEKQRIAEQERQQNAAAIANEARLLEEKRKRALFDMTATDRQKEMLRIQEQMFEFMGPAGVVQGFAPPGVLGAPEMLAQLQQEGKAAGMQFLQAQATLLEKEIEALQQASSPEIIGGMQQNALQAQADAFKQMFATVNKQNPQLTLLAQKLDAVKKAIDNGNIFQLVGP